MKMDPQPDPIKPATFLWHVDQVVGETIFTLSHKIMETGIFFFYTKCDLFLCSAQTYFVAYICESLYIFMFLFGSLELLHYI